jgi:hypothetical protein
MGKKQKSKSGGARKIGRNLRKCKMYRDNHIRERNKLKRVLQSCGRAFAEKWALEHGMSLPSL